MKLTTRILIFLLACAFFGAAFVAANRLLIPSGNTAATHFDTLIVLGYPANLDGTASPEMRERILEGVREYRAGVAPAIIMTGTSAHNKFNEAGVMALLAEREGVPASAILIEPEARNTIQNVYYSSRIMQAHHWHSAEVVSSPAHIGRAAMILQATAKAHPDLAVDWHTHASLWPAEYSFLHRIFLDAFEATRCLEIRMFGFPVSAFLPNG